MVTMVTMVVAQFPPQTIATELPLQSVECSSDHDSKLYICPTFSFYREGL